MDKIDKIMKNCLWEEIHGFASYNEFNNFVEWLKTQIRDGIAEETLIQPLFEADDFSERGFIHKKSTSIWRLIWSDGPSYTGSFRTIENKNKCPWNEIKGVKKDNKDFFVFKNFDDFEKFSFWLVKQTSAGKAEEMLIDSSTCSVGEKWYLHKGSNTVWKLVYPDGPMPPYFKEVNKPKSEAKLR